MVLGVKPAGLAADDVILEHPMKGQIPCYLCVASLFSLLLRPIEITPRGQNLRENVAHFKVCMCRKITTFPPLPNWYLFPDVYQEGVEFSSNWLGAVCVLQEMALHQDKSLQKQNNFLKASMACIGTAILKQVFLAPCKQHSCPGGCQTRAIPLTESSGFLNKFFNSILEFATLLLSAWYHQGSKPIAWELSSEPTSFYQVSTTSSGGIETAARLPFA